MVNTVETQTILNGPRNLVVKVHIDGDGSGEETAKLIIDASAYGADAVQIMRVVGSLTGFTAELLWDATADVHALNVPDYDTNEDFRSFGGLPNNAGAGKTGDILMNTTGLGLGDNGTIILEMVKK